jgi:lysophospholipase L1-like esterase
MNPKIFAFLVLIVLPVLRMPGQTAPNPVQWEKDIAAFERSDSLQVPVKKGVLFVGSSSVRLWNDLPKRFPGQKTINRGFGGSWLSDAVHYFDRIVLPYQPRTIVVYSGENDIAGGKSAQSLLKDFEALLSLKQKYLPESKLIFISLKPSPSRHERLDEMKKANALIRERMSREKRAVFVDVFTPMLDAAGKPREALFGPDQLHMNRLGYDLWTQLLKPHLN